MLHIQCTKCGAILKGKEVNITIQDAYINGIKYKSYVASCNKCGGVVMHERIAKMTAKSKAKAMVKLARKKQPIVKQVTEEEEYAKIMQRVGKRAKELALSHPSNTAVRVEDLYAAVDELPAAEKGFVLAYEDKQDIALLKAKTKKDVSHIANNSILLLTQGIIESAIAENDEDFFKSEYGEQIVDTYNTTLTIYKGTDYEITAALLLEKMRKKSIATKGEEDND